MSMRSLLRWLLVIQAAGVAAIAYALHRWLGVAPWLALLAGLARPLLARPVIGAHNFSASARHGSPTPPRHALTPGARLRLFAQEFKASFMVGSWHMLRA